MTTTMPVRGKVSAEDYFAILDFYARQMHLLDGLQLEGYADTFTHDAVVDHVHSGHRLVGRDEMMAFMVAALPRYQRVVVRHWFDHLLIEPSETGWHVDYYSLVTRTGPEGVVSCEPTFTVQDELVRGDDGGIVTRQRIIHQDRPAVVTAEQP